MNDLVPHWMICPTCRGMGQRRAAHVVMDTNRYGATLLHLMECCTCDGSGWTDAGVIPPA